MALTAIEKWALDTALHSFVLGGLAGTGKTTLLKEVVTSLSKAGLRISIGAFTGKAVSVLHSKGLTSACTLHSLFYLAERNPDGTYNFIRRPRHELSNIDLLIVDEASMLSKDLLDEIRYFELRTLFVGDHGQLEPVGENPFIMKHPDFKLEKILRQVDGNPIIPFSHKLREGFHPSQLAQDSLLLKVGPRSKASFDSSFQILCGFNATRSKLNNIIRQRLSHSGLLNVGEKVICLRNNMAHNVFNGLTGIVHSLHLTDNILYVTMQLDNGAFRGPFPVVTEQFGFVSNKDNPDPDPPYSWKHKPSEFVRLDYAYAISVHKSQGSEWPAVAVYEESFRLWTMPRWRYTAATRSSSQLHYLYED